MRDIRTGSPWRAPVPAVSFGSAASVGRPVAPSGSVGDGMRAARGGARLVPAVGGGQTQAGGWTPPTAAPDGAPPVHRAASGSSATIGSTATPPDRITIMPMPVADQPVPAPVPSDRQHHHDHHQTGPDMGSGRKRWEAHP